MCACKAISVYNKRGMEAFRQGRIDDALNDLEEAIRLAAMRGGPMHVAKIRNNLALVLQASGRREQARQELGTALIEVEGRIGRNNKLYDVISRNMAAVSSRAA
ncbi:hypothetical protein JCM15519_06080 [Fundidesulfovibrio butyratiphilus]